MSGLWPLVTSSWSNRRTNIKRRARFAGRGSLGYSITVIQWEMNGGRFETGIVFGGGEEQRLAWERRLAGQS